MFVMTPFLIPKVSAPPTPKTVKMPSFLAIIARILVEPISRPKIYSLTVSTFKISFGFIALF